uniref:Allorecognition 2-like protein n=1 Tax=Hydractinia polyclina TaxID=589945 RepID=E3U3G7_9CNID|nr:allorecognition 2-like protein [Hydractinia polyclina]
MKGFWQWKQFWKCELKLFVLILCSGISVKCVKFSAKQPIVSAEEGGNASLTFVIQNLDAGETIFSVVMFLLPNTVSAFAEKSFSLPFATTKNVGIYQDRVNASENGNEFTLTFSNLTYTDMLTIKGQLLTKRGDDFKPYFANASISEIFGGPTKISEVSSTLHAEEATRNYNISVILQGHPKPTVTWSIGEDVITKSVKDETVDERNKKYKYILTIPEITSDMNKKIITLKAIGYNKKTFSQLITLNVTWGPQLCNNDKKTEVYFNNIKTATFTTCAYGNPKPKIKMNFDGKSIDAVTSSNTAEKDKYKYTAKLSSYLIPSRCGKILTVITGKNSKDGERDYVLKYKLPPVITKSNFKKQDGCIHTSWIAPNTGKCAVSYKVDYINRNNVTIHSKVFHNKELNTSLCDEKVASDTISVRVTAVSNDTIVEPGDDGGKSSGNTTAVIVGVVVGAVLLIGFVVALYWYYFRKGNSEKDSEKQSTGSGRRPLNEGTPLPHRSDADGYAIADDLLENNVERKNNTEAISLAQLDDGTYDQLEVKNDNPYIKNGAIVDNAAAKANPPNNMKTYDSATNAVDQQPKKPEVYAYSRPRNTGDYNGVNPLAGKSTNQNLYSEPERQTSPEQPLGAGKSGASNQNLYAQVEKDKKQPSEGEKYQPQHYDKVCDPPETPAHIQQMYAQIDKSKKRKK